MQFRTAIQLDRQSLSRYEAYAEYLGIVEDMDKLRELGREIAERFPTPRGYLALARLSELTGEIDVAIAWGLKALRSLRAARAAQAQSGTGDQVEEAQWQVGEFYARIGDFATAARYDPQGVGQFWLQRRYNELIDLAQERIIEHPDDVRTMYYLAFAYNATGDFASAKRLFESMGMPPPDDAFGVGIDGQQLVSYIDALQSLGGSDSLVAKLASYEVDHFTEASKHGIGKSWWVNTLLACPNPSSVVTRTPSTRSIACAKRKGWRNLRSCSIARVSRAWLRSRAIRR